MIFNIHYKYDEVGSMTSTVVVTLYSMNNGFFPMMWKKAVIKNI